MSPVGPSLLWSPLSSFPSAGGALDLGIGMHPPVAVVLKASLQSNQTTLRYTCSVTCEGGGEGGGGGGGGGVEVEVEVEVRVEVEVEAEVEVEGGMGGWRASPATHCSVLSTLVLGTT